MDSPTSKIPRRRPAEDSVSPGASQKRRIDTPTPDPREASKNRMRCIVDFYYHLWESAHFVMKDDIALFFEVSTPKALERVISGARDDEEATVVDNKPAAMPLPPLQRPQLVPPRVSSQLSPSRRPISGAAAASVVAAKLADVSL